MSGRKKLFVGAGAVCVAVSLVLALRFMATSEDAALPPDPSASRHGSPAAAPGKTDEASARSEDSPAAAGDRPLAADAPPVLGDMPTDDQPAAPTFKELRALHEQAANREQKRNAVSNKTITDPDLIALDDADKPYVVQLKNRSFLPGKGGEISFAGESAVMFLQFWHFPNRFERTQLDALGVEIRQRTPANCAHVNISRKAFDRVMRLDFVRGAAAIEPGDRISPLVDRIEDDSHAMTEDGRLRLVWRGYHGTTQQTLRSAGSHVDGVTVLGRAGREHAVFIEATHEGVEGLSRLEMTHWIEPVAPPPAPSNVDAAQASGVDVLYSSPNDLTGAGVKVMLLDGGAARDTHDDLVGRVTVLETANADGSPYGGHATHVAGTIAGDGTSNPAARGMASAAQLYSYSFFDGTTEEQLDKIEEALSTYGCRLSNHSWGGTNGYALDATGTQWVMMAPESLFGEYTGVSADWDESIMANDLILVKSAGNDRMDGPDASNHDGEQALDGEYYDLIGPLAGVKNAITVGAASDTASYFGIDGITSFSCFGPTDDGRIKPEVVFNGDSVLSCWSDSDTSTNSISGTSMATPGVTGTIALLMERYKTRFGVYPNAAWVRAVLTCYATDLGSPGPDYQYGFGIVDAATSLEKLDGHSAATPHWLQALILSGTTNFHLLWKGTDASSPLTVNCAWIDEAGDPAAAKALVTDLDMWVSPLADPATKYYPWSLGGLVSPDANATRSGSNSVDNIEQVRVDGLASGWYGVYVEGISGDLQYCLASYDLLHPNVAGSDDRFEENDVSGSPYVFATFPAVGLNLQCFDDDWYSFNVASAGALGVYVLLDDRNGPLSLQVYDASFASVTATEGTTNPSANSGVGTEYVLCNVTPGTYYAKVSGFGGATNSHYSFVAMQPSVSENLTVKSVKSRSGIFLGETIEVEVEVFNSDWGQTAACNGQIRLSPDSVIDGSDRLLASFAIPSLLGIHDTTVNVSVAIPVDVVLGDYHLGAIVDSGGVIAESDEGDNTGSTPVTVMKPDDGYEDNDDPTSATLVALNATYSDLVCYDIDCYRIQPSTDATLTVRADFLNSNGNLMLLLADPAGNLLDESSGENDGETITAALTAGTYYIVVLGEGSQGSVLPTNDDYSLRIGYGTPPSFTSTAVTSAEAGSAYSYTPSASGSPATTIAASGLPAWLSWDGTILSGTPGGGDVGTTGDITLTGSNGVAPDATQVFQITVSGVAPNFTSSAVTSAQEATSYAYTPTASGSPAPAITASGLPGWLSWNGTILSGTPGGGDVGTTGDITLTASNGVAPDAAQVFQIVVSAAPAPPSGGGGCTPGSNPGMLPALAAGLCLLIGRRKRQRN